MKILRLLLPVLFLGYMSSATLFMHTHYINGVAVVHSHPYKSADDGSSGHQHSNQGFLLIAVLSHISVLVAAAGIVCLAAFVFYKTRQFVTRRKALIGLIHCSAFGLRAPPFSVSC
ncbi:MAG: hypothetical protein AB7V36_07840 [Bacteroidales bacterium]|nr:hypothetical protein [Bacteroidales bacterium]